jgi:hypothetical protein
MANNDASLQDIKVAMKDRALYLAFLYRGFLKAVPTDVAEKVARQAIFQYGQFKGQQDGQTMTAESWVDQSIGFRPAPLFKLKVEKRQDSCVQEMGSCPLVEAWQELGCSPEEINLLCDIAMEVDRGRAAYHGIPLSTPQRIANGDPVCLLVLGKTAAK